MTDKQLAVLLDFIRGQMGAELNILEKKLPEELLEAKKIFGGETMECSLLNPLYFLCDQIEQAIGMLEAK